MLIGDELAVGDWARRRAREIVLEPPVPGLARPLLETVNFITIALLPARIRDEYRFAPLPPAWSDRRWSRPAPCTFAGASCPCCRPTVVGQVPGRAARRPDCSAHVACATQGR